MAANPFTYRQESRVRSIARDEVESHFQWERFRGFLDKMNLWSTVENRVQALVGERVPPLVDRLTREACERQIPGMVNREMTSQFMPWLDNSGKVQQILNTHLNKTRAMMEQETIKGVTEMQRAGQHVVEQMSKSDVFSPIYQEITAHGKKIAEEATQATSDVVIHNMNLELALMKEQRNEVVAELAQKTKTIDDLRSSVKVSNWVSGMSLALGIGSCAASLIMARN